jgi:hypothetical protein
VLLSLFASDSVARLTHAVATSPRPASSHSRPVRAVDEDVLVARAPSSGRGLQSVAQVVVRTQLQECQGWVWWPLLSQACNLRLQLSGLPGRLTCGGVSCMVCTQAMVATATAGVSAELQDMCHMQLDLLSLLLQSRQLAGGTGTCSMSATGNACRMDGLPSENFVACVSHN